MQSIKSQYCELIAAGKKTIEVRKTKPKLETPFKVYIYCTQPKEYFSIGYHMRSAADYLYMLDNGTVKFGDGFEDYDKSKIGLNGKVIGEYICDEIIGFGFSPYNHGEYVGDYGCYNNNDILKESCLSFEEMYDYIGEGSGYLWHITNLKIYDKPKELKEFEKAWRNSKGEYHDIRPCQNGKSCMHIYYDDSEHAEACAIDYSGDNCPYTKLTRPPQSWCYCEEVS